MNPDNWDWSVRHVGSSLPAIFDALGETTKDPHCEGRNGSRRVYAKVFEMLNGRYRWLRYAPYSEGYANTLDEAKRAASIASEQPAQQAEGIHSTPKCPKCGTPGKPGYICRAKGCSGAIPHDDRQEGVKE